MATQTLDGFLENAVLARKAGVTPRVVVRRFHADARSLGRQLEAESVAVDRTPECELVVGSVVLARGKIVESNGGYAFRVTEVMQ
jgi:hypothetical protein